jgi:hypothetical protein
LKFPVTLHSSLTLLIEALGARSSIPIWGGIGERLMKQLVLDGVEQAAFRKLKWIPTLPALAI